MSDHQPPLVVGRYLLHRKIARGGMATIHIARLLGDVGFSRIVAAKRLHPELAEDAELVAMFLDEASIASRVRHRNVVNVLDVVTLGDEVMLVQEYVHGVPLGVLLRAAYDKQSHVPVPVAAAIACQVLAGLHAAHETTDELGMPLCIVHRDVSPQNIMIAADGSARLLDFGVAKAALSAHVTQRGTFKGKLAYSAPEHLRGEAVRQSDIYSLGVVLWELLVGHRLHALAQTDAQLINQILNGKVPLITEALAEERPYIGAYRWSQLEAIAPVLQRALEPRVKKRWETAQDMEEALAAVVPLASPGDISAWLRAVGRDFLEERERLIAEEETSWRRHGPNLARSSVSHIPPPSIATEPRMQSVPPTSWLGRIPNAFIAALMIVLGAAIAFFVRDLDATSSPTAAIERAFSLPTAATSRPEPEPAAAPPAPEQPAPAALPPPHNEPPPVEDEPPLPHDEPPLPHDE